MKKRTSYIPSDKRDQKLLGAGRGQGTGRNYVCFLQVHEEYYYGTSFRKYNSRLQRMHQVFGRNQIRILLNLMYDPNIVDIQENKPVAPKSEAIEIASKLRNTDPKFKYPKYSRSHDPALILTDFLITYRDGSRKAIIIHSNKYDNDLHKQRETAIQKVYYQRRHIPVKEINEQDINVIRSNNIREIITRADAFSDDFFPAEAEAYLLQLYRRTFYRVATITARCEKKYSLPQGAGITLFYKLLRNGKIRMDIDQTPLNLNQSRIPKHTVTYEPKSSLAPEKKLFIPVVGSVLKSYSNTGVPDKYPARIIDIDYEKDTAYLILLDKKSCRPFPTSFSALLDQIENGSVRSTDDPYKKIKHVKITEAMQAFHDQWVEIIFNFILKAEDRANIIRDEKFYSDVQYAIRENYGYSYKTIRRIIAKLWKSGFRDDALYPDYTSRGRKENAFSEYSLFPDVAKKIEKFLWDNYAVRSHPTIEETYDQFLITYYLDPEKNHENLKPGDLNNYVLPEEQLPTWSQFYYQYRKWLACNRREVLKRTNGNVEYNLKNRDIMRRNDYLPCGPGSRYLVDSTDVDYCLVTRERSDRILGRPVLTFVLDLYSHMIAGYYVGLKDESDEAVRMALYCAFTDKPTLCKRYDVAITEDMWPVHHIPCALVVDNGKAYDSILSDNYCKKLFIDIENLEPDRGDLKAQLEHEFWFIDNHFGKMAGAVDTNRDTDYRDSAKVTLPQLHQLIIDFILRFNSTYAVSLKPAADMCNEDIMPNPISLWNWGITHRSGMLRTLPADVVLTEVLPEKKARITAYGLESKNLIYKNKEIRDVREWFVKARNHIPIIKDSEDPFEITVKYDPGLAGSVFYLDPETNSLIEFRLEDEDYDAYGEKSLDEVEYEMDNKKVLHKKQGEKARASKRTAQIFRKQILDKASKKKKKDLKEHGGNFDKGHKDIYRSQENMVIVHENQNAMYRKGNK